MNTTASLSPRFHSMDALRGFALMLGVVFHAAESFCPERWSWAVVDPNAHAFFAWFQHLCHSFRMELFFLIAGFFAHLVFHRRGAREFLRNRFWRIFVPFVVGWVVLYPVFGWIWLIGFAQGGRLDSLGIPAEYHHLPAWQLLIGAFMSADFWRENFSTIHLWFLHQLLGLYILFIGGRWILNRVLSAKTYARGAQALDRFGEILFTSKVAWIVLPFVTIPALLLMDGWGVDTPNNSIFLHFPTTLLYGLFFGAGWVLHRQHSLLTRLTHGQTPAFFLLLGAGLSLATFEFNTLLQVVELNALEGTPRRLLYTLLYACMMWSFVIGCMALFQRYANRESPTWRYIADASYWIYLIHHIVVVPLQIHLAPWDLPAGIKFVFIVGLATPALFGSYHFLVRFTWIGRGLNGKRYPRTKALTAQPALEMR